MVPAYNEGQVVRARIAPELNLIVRRFIDQVYFCKVQNDPDAQELVYFERELEAAAIPNEPQEA